MLTWRHPDADTPLPPGAHTFEAQTVIVLRRYAVATETTERYPVEIRERPKPQKPKPKGGKR